MEKIEVLDRGFVELVDLLGGDGTAVRAARVSYMSKSDPDGDRRLLDLLMKQGHESPFEHVVFTFRVKAPIFVARQWHRHRIASVNERSGRFTEFAEEFYIPGEDRAGGGAELMRESMHRSFEDYKKLLDKGVKRETARMVLPVSLYTEWFWSVNVRSLMNFLDQRADAHAQYEIQRYALAVAEFFEAKCPLTYGAFMKHHYKGTLLKEGCK